MLLGIVVCALAQGALAVLVAFQTRAIFAAFGANEATPLTPLLILMGSALMMMVLRVVEKAVADMLGYAYVRSLRVRLFNRISRLSVENLQSHKQGSLHIRFVGDLSAIQNWVGQAIPGLISAVVLLPGLLFVLYWLHPMMAVIGVALACACMLAMRLLSHKLKPVQQSVRAKRGGLASYVASRLSQAPFLRVMGLRRSLSRQIDRRSNVLQRSAVKRSAVINSFKGLPDIFLQSLYTICILLAFWLEMTAAEAAVVLAVIAIFSQPFGNLAEFWEKRSAFLVSQRKCNELLETSTISRGKKKIISSSELDGVRIEVRSLQTRGHRFRDALIPANSNTLITGEAGSGKSAFMKVLIGVSQPLEGNVYINGSPAALLAEKSRQRLFAYIDDAVPIYASTLKSTLTLGVFGKVRLEEIERALAGFDLEDLAQRLGGLSGRVLEHGKNLSRAEIARIACCRAWLSASKFILIDDIDALKALVDRGAIERLLEKKSASVIACSRHPQQWQGGFDNRYEMPTAPRVREAA